MGVIKRGVLGGFSGKVANVVGSSWKGIAVMKSLPLSVANPKTAAQVAQRGAFSQCSAVASLLLVTYVKPLWDRFAQQMSGYNAFVQANIDKFDTTGLINFVGFSIGEGSLTGVTATIPASASGSPNANLSWTINSGDGTALATDEAYLTAYNETNGEWAQFVLMPTRGDGLAQAVFPSDLTAADIVHYYLAFRRADGTLVSNTAYNTEVIV